MHLRKCRYYITYLEYLILSVNNWLNAIKLILNALKAKAIIIPPKTRQQAPNIKIIIDCCEICVVDFVRYFGIYLDNKLTFDSRTSYLQSKLSCSIGIISKIFILLYFAILHSHITSCLIIWYST